MAEERLKFLLATINGKDEGVRLYEQAIKLMKTTLYDHLAISWYYLGSGELSPEDTSPIVAHSPKSQNKDE